LNEELGAVAEQLDGMVLSFTEKASETGRLYGSVNTQMIAERISEKTGVEISRSQVESQPLRTLGEHTVQIRLTVDLLPEVTVIVNSEGEVEEAIVIQEPARPESEEDVEEVEALVESSVEIEGNEDEGEAEELAVESEAESEELSEEIESEDTEGILGVETEAAADVE